MLTRKRLIQSHVFWNKVHYFSSLTYNHTVLLHHNIGTLSVAQSLTEAPMR